MELCPYTIMTLLYNQYLILDEYNGKAFSIVHGTTQGAGAQRSGARGWVGEAVFGRYRRVAGQRGCRYIPVTYSLTKALRSRSTMPVSKRHRKPTHLPNPVSIRRISPSNRLFTASKERSVW